MKKIKFILGALLAVLPLSACVKDRKLDPYQGYWVDVNGDTTLEFNGSKLTISYGSGNETYKVKTEEKYGETTIVSTDGRGFGLMGDITVGKDGKLRAYEEILDADGHSYVFVREADLEKERAVQDLSKDLPKTIESHEIEHFSLSFGRPYDLDEEWPDRCWYSWTIEQEEDGSWQCSYHETFDSYMGRRYEGELPESFMKDLDLAVRESGAPEVNGYDMRNNVQSSSYSLHVTYTSGEEIEVYASGDPADTCVIRLQGMMNLMVPYLNQ